MKAHQHRCPRPLGAEGGRANIDFGLPHDTFTTRVIVIQFQIRANRVHTPSRRVVAPVVSIYRIQFNARAGASENVLALPQ